MSKLKVAFIHTQLAGVAMYRVTNMAKYLNKFKLAKCFHQELDIDSVNLHAWEANLSNPNLEGKIMKDLHELIKGKDIVIYQKFFHPKGIDIIRATRKSYPKTVQVFEIDDYMFSVPSWNLASAVFRPGNALFNLGVEQMLRSDCVVTSTNGLKELYKSFNRKTHVVPNGIDRDWWGKVENNNKNNKKIKIGWSGANAHMEDLQVVFPAVKQILADCPNVEFEFWGPASTFPEEFDKVQGLTLNKEWVVLSKYPEALKSRGFDIGIAPLRDCHFNRGKSNLRWLEYSMLGIPTVASDVGGQFNECIEEGKTGFISKPCDFYRKLRLLIDDEKLRREVGKNALECVQTNYMAENSAKTYAEVLTRIKEDKYEFLTNGGNGSVPAQPIPVSQ